MRANTHNYIYIYIIKLQIASYLCGHWQPSGGVLFLRGYKIIGFLCPKGEVDF